jgi:hypothetical protein
MKRIIVIIVSVAVIIASIFSVLPAIAGESHDNTIAGNYLSVQPFYSPKALSVNSISEHNTNSYIQQAGKPLTFSLLAIDPDDNPLVYSASNLPPGSTFDPQTRAFSWTPSAAQRGIYPGIHFEVTDGELTDFEDITITVGATEQVVFSVSSLRINPTKTNVGKKVNIRVIVTNSGNVAGTYEVILSINGAIEDRQTVTLTTGATQEVKFNTVKNIPGTYKIDINGLSGSFVVVKQARVS